MRALLATLLAFYCFAASADDKRPGYGVVEAVTPVRSQASASEPSASAGSSAASPHSSKINGKYWVRVRLDDGTIQYRTLKKREFAAGDRVLLTNAGDVVPE